MQFRTGAFPIILACALMVALGTSHLACDDGGRSRPGAQKSTGAVPCGTPWGVLDATFAGKGYVLERDVAGGGRKSTANDIAIDREGRIVVIGESYGGATGTDIVILRYTEDGVADPTLNGTGRVVHHNGLASGVNDGAEALAIDSAGRIVITGHTAMIWGNGEDLAVWRFLEDGSLDPSFGTSGLVFRECPHGAANGNDVVLDDLDRIVVTGTQHDISGSWDMILWRFDATGALDPTFAGTGYVVDDAGSGDGNNSQGLGITRDETGRILVTGHSWGEWADMTIWRFLEDGSLDPSWAGRGWVKHANAAGGLGDDHGLDIVVDREGRIVVSGASHGYYHDMAVWRYRPDGTLDTSLAGKGWVSYNTLVQGDDEEFGHAVAVDGGGRIVVAGVINPGTTDMAIWRLLDDGSPDPNWHGLGIFWHDGAAGDPSGEGSRAVVIDSCQRILTAGHAVYSPEAYAQMAVWRVR